MEEKVNKKEWYHKRLILEIVKQGEEGGPGKYLERNTDWGNVLCMIG